MLVTSRRRLTDLEGAVPLPLTTLPPKEAELLFCRLARREPSGREVAAVAEAVRLCGHLPLAISLLAGRLAAHDSWTVSHLVAEFGAAQDRIAELATGDLAIASAFEMSYRDLPPDRQRLFRRLSLHPGVEIDAYAAAALDAIPVSTARRGLEALYTDHLLDEPAPAGTASTTCCATMPAPSPRTTRPTAPGRRPTDSWTTTNTPPVPPTAISRASPAPPPHSAGTTLGRTRLPDWHAASAWMRTERANLSPASTTPPATTSSAVDQPHRQHGRAPVPGGPWTQAALHQRAAVAADRLGDRLGQANALNVLGCIQSLAGKYAEAADSLHRALDLFEELDDRLGQANALNDLGQLRCLTGTTR
ncbi:hypothetical protein NKH77_52375 [Streptomyces sp. M19]